nr:Chain B, capsid protein [Human immunodeficiency virus type 2 (ISOLATE ROD)]
PGPLPA